MARVRLLSGARLRCDFQMSAQEFRTERRANVAQSQAEANATLLPVGQQTPHVDDAAEGTQKDESSPSSPVYPGHGVGYYHSLSADRKWLECF